MESGVKSLVHHRYRVLRCGTDRVMIEVPKPMNHVSLCLHGRSKVSRGFLRAAFLDFDHGSERDGVSRDVVLQALHP